MQSQNALEKLAELPRFLFLRHIHRQQGSQHEISRFKQTLLFPDIDVSKLAYYLEIVATAQAKKKFESFSMEYHIFIQTPAKLKLPGEVPHILIGISTSFLWCKFSRGEERLQRKYFGLELGQVIGDSPNHVIFISSFILLSTDPALVGIEFL
jgi:hypothetical protein